MRIFQGIPIFDKDIKPVHQIRAALIEGMRGYYPEPERQRYRRLVKDLSDFDEHRVDKLFDILRENNPTPKQINFLNVLFQEFNYRSPDWKPLTPSRISDLKNEGVIIQHDGSDRDLVQRVLDTDDAHVIFVDKEIADPGPNPYKEIDYEKHIKHQNALQLNGWRVVRQWAKNKGIEDMIPDDAFKKNPGFERGYNQFERDFLESHGFTFTDALGAGIDALTQDTYFAKKRIPIIRIVTKGRELRQSFLDMVEAAELIACTGNPDQLASHRHKEVVKTLGDLFKYHGANIYQVPSRDGNGKVYSVTIHNLPDLDEDQRVLDWTNMTAESEDPNAKNKTNFQLRMPNGEIMNVYVIEAHAGAAILDTYRRKKIDAGDPTKAPQNMSPLPSEELVRFTDFLRYNVAYDPSGLAGNRHRLREAEINILLTELAKRPDWDYDRMFRPKSKIGNYMFRQMHTT